MPIETELILKAILDNSPQNIVLTDREFKVLACNEQIRQTLFPFFGRYLQPGDDYRDFVVEPLMSIYLTAFEKALKGEVTVVELPTEFGQTKFWFQYRVNPVYLPGGGELLGVTLSAENITDRKQAERELSASESKFRSLVEQSLVGVFILVEGHFVYVNPALANILALENQQPLSNYLLIDFVHEDDRPRLTSCSVEVLEGKQEKCHLVLSAFAADGEVRSLEVNLSRITYNDQPALLASALDITERIDEEIRINEAVEHAQELERSQMGMELHDNVKQLLVSCIFQLRLCLESFPLNEDARAVIEKSVSYVEQSMSELRRLSHRLAPALDEEAMMREKVAELVDRMRLKETTRVNMEIDQAAEELDPAVKQVVYRIVQEQLTNIAHHAQATNAGIKIQKEGGRLFVTVKDDGVGFDMSKKTTGIGMQNIRRRVQVLGGDVHVRSSPGAGVLLEASMPV